MSKDYEKEAEDKILRWLKEMETPDDQDVKDEKVEDKENDKNSA